MKGYLARKGNHADARMLGESNENEVTVLLRSATLIQDVAHDISVSWPR